MFSSLFRCLYITCVISIQYLTSSMYSNVITSTQNKFIKCTYLHLCLFHLKLSNIQQVEQIKTIQFHLKIWELCTFLLQYTLGLMCRFGVSHPKMAFFCFRPKKKSFFTMMSPQVKIFLFSNWSLIDHL